ncbi:MAG TPA: GNAT family N-acetyltransferase [Gemmatimonadales bacterium]
MKVAHHFGTERAFRRATAADVETLSGLAQRAKAGWGYPAAWLEEWRPLLTLSPGDLEALDVVLAEGESGIVGFYALVHAMPVSTLEHLWVEPSVQRRGWGRRLLDHALATARAGGARALRVEADPNAVPFYLGAGARVIGERLTRVAETPRRLPLLEISWDAP